MRNSEQKCAPGLAVHPLSQSETQAWLQKAMIVDCGIEYCSEIGTQPEHVAYGTMILVRMPPGQASV